MLPHLAQENEHFSHTYWGSNMYPEEQGIWFIYVNRSHKKEKSWAFGEWKAATFVDKIHHLWFLLCECQRWWHLEKKKKKYQWTRVWPCMTYKQYSKTLILRGGKMTLNVCFSTTRTQTQRAAVALSCQKLALPVDGWIRGGKYTVQSGYRDRRRGPHTLDILHKSLNVEKHGVYLHKSSIWIEF